MFVVTYDETTRAVTGFYMPPKPVPPETFAGSTTQVYVDASAFLTGEAVIHFKNNCRKYQIAADGKPQRYLP